jgi:hypothetical protein
MWPPRGQAPNSLRQRLLQWKDFFPIIGPISGSLIVALVTLAVAFVVTQRLTTATKRTEFFLEFTKRYQSIYTEKRNLDRNVQIARQNVSTYQPNAVEEGDANLLFYQLFGLIYDEFYAYQHNFLEPEVFVQWMRRQWHDAKNTQFEGVPYRDGLDTWLRMSAVQSHPTTRKVEEIFKCATEDCVRDVVVKYAPPWWRFW